MRSAVQGVTRASGALALAVVGACGVVPTAPDEGAPEEDSVVSGSAEGTMEVRDPLEFVVAGIASGVAGAQGPARRMAVGGAFPDTGWRFDTGTDSGSSTPAAACEESMVGALEDAASLQVAGVTTWFVVPPIFDLGFDRGEAGFVARGVSVVAVSGGGCSVLASLPDADSERFVTGFGSTIDGMHERFSAPAGLMIRLVAQDDALWLFSNATDVWWSIDLDDASVTSQPALPGAAAGAVSDGEGGAWVSILGKLDWPEGSSADQPAAVVRLDSTGALDGTSFTLPFDVGETGFGRLDETPPAYDDGSFTTMLTPHYLSNDLALGPDGRLWVLDSEGAELAAIDPATGTTSTVALPLIYPTGIAAEDGQLVVTAGLEGDRVTGVIHQEPGLYTVSTTDGSTSAALTLPAPADGWNLTRGFVSTSDPATSETRGIYRDAWLSLVGTGEGALLVADPKSGRLIVVE